MKAEWRSHTQCRMTLRRRLFREQSIGENQL